MDKNIDQPINMSKIVNDKQCLSGVIDMQLVFSNMHCHDILASALYIHNANKIDERLSKNATYFCCAVGCF